VQRYRHREDAGYRLRVMQGRVHQAAKYVQNTPALTAKTPRFGLQITATLRAFSPTSFITQRDGSCRRNSAHGWLTHLGGRLRMPVHSWEPVESHRRPTSGHIEPIGAFDSSVLPGIQTQPDTSTDIRNLVRIGWSSLSNLEPMDHKSGYGFPCVSMAAYLDRSGARLIEGDRHDQIAQPMRRHHHRGQRRPPDRASAG
jgi:hypothetical protein